MKRFVFSLVTVCSLVAFQSAASAQAPDACSSASAARAFRAGRMAGISLVQQSWASVADCERVEELEDLVMSAIERYTPGSAPSIATQCRYEGVVQGAQAELDLIAFGCEACGTSFECGCEQSP